ncbi:O-antigen polysaccharide polymerase Wzy [Limosilactobacillus fermentum]|uniref:O-antigen polysaccharide polymerase Wzy n=1 Tax=Limosilactobacillus fermentum TaxID=1613 RepID=UPI0025705F16|nr:O-antigen polysaccharide polymerase Wzy [Limosilactobacillus fermentum]WJD84933.1 O-antigen polysaccharide polymerase Wzy [Limosilactobacillus fermentum]
MNYYLNNNYTRNKDIVKKVVLIITIALTSIIFQINLGSLEMYETGSIWLALLLNVSLIFISLIINGIDFVTLFIFCINLLLFPITIQFFTGTSYGDLQANIIPLNLPKLYTYSYIYCTCFLLLSLLFTFKSHEIRTIKVKLPNYSSQVIIFNNIIAIIFTFVAFPRLGFSINNIDNRFDMLLPGHAWNQLAIVALLFNLPYLRKNVTVKLTYLFVLCWFLMNGERADITGLVFGLFLFYFIKTSQERSPIKTVELFALLFLFVILLNLIASWRGGEHSTIIESINKLLVTPTTSDVAYLYNVSIDMISKFGKLHGKIFLANLISAIPLSSPVDFSSTVDNFGYLNPGGEPILAEPIVDFGVKGLYLLSFIDFIFYRFFVQFKNSFFKYEFLVLLCSVPRIVWYGRSYAYSSLLFFVPFMFIADYLINNPKCQFKLERK